jgi:hypothetical protein
VNKLALLTLAAAAIFASAGGASAQGTGYYGSQNETRHERGYDGHRHGYDNDRRSYRRIVRACPRNYTVQDGVCKPYRGY